MKRLLTYLLIIIAALALYACVSAPKYEPVPDQTTAGPGEALFQRGEQFLSIYEIGQALEQYRRYLSLHPQGNRADQALYRIGFIYDRQGMYEESQAFYRRLITQFPQSPYANDARLAIIDQLFKQQRADQAIARAEQMLAGNPDADTRNKLWLRLERYHSQAGEMADAVAYAYMLYTSATETGKAQWAEKLNEGIGRLNAEQIESLWDRMQDDAARSQLMYRYATIQVVAENYDDAIKILIAFQEAYPDHPYSEDAAQIVGTLEQRLSFTPQTVGCLLPLSGSYEVYGRRALNGIELAMSLFRSVEVPSTIKLVIKDSASDDRRAIQGVRDLANAGVGAVLGPIVTALPAAGEAQRLNIPMVTFTQKSNVTEVGDYIFRHFITPQSQVKSLVSYFTNNVGLRDFAIMYPKESYGETFMTLFWEEVIRQGGRVVGVESYETQQTDFATAIEKLVGTHHTPPKDLLERSAVTVDENPYFSRGSAISGKFEDVLPDPVTRLTGLFFQDPDQDRAKGPRLGRRQVHNIAEPNVDFDVLFIPDAPKTAGLILPQLAYYDIRDIYLAGTNLWHSDQLITMTRDYAQNAVMAEGFYNKSPEKSVRRFVQAYRDLYGKEPGLIEAFAFDTAWLVFKLLSKSDIRHRHEMRDALLQLFETDGVTGPTAFAQNGEAIKSLSLLKIKGGEFLEIPRQ
ncbi:MAG: penicillin-binding protein activator [Desulfobacteraceae bacterium]|jgi:ABC-type branched-subunit amino acid transport system substrate-binding protein/outer membrane protein assembly factor BamD (BamD/ComL family)